MGMDTFAFLLGIILLLFSIQFGEWWLAIGIIAVLIITQKSLKMTAAILVSSAIFFLVKTADVKALWPWVVIGLAVVASLLSLKEKPQTPEFDPSVFAGMGGGEGGMEGNGYGGTY